MRDGMTVRDLLTSASGAGPEHHVMLIIDGHSAAWLRRAEVDPGGNTLDLLADSARTEPWPADVDPARWLRGACSSGNPLRSAVVAVTDEVEQLREELAKVRGHRAELAERCYRKDLELDELRVTAWADD